MTGATRRPLAVLMASCLLVAVAACGGSHSSSGSELHARRADLATSAKALLATRAALAREVVAARAAWPLIDHGLPRPVPASLRPRGRASSRTAKGRRAAALRTRQSEALARRLAVMAPAVDTAVARGQALPATLVAHPEELTGAGSAIAGVYELGAGLAAHGLTYVQGALAAARGGSPAARAFLRANVNTYIISVYDGNFDLALLGKMLASAYARLGGPKAFHGSLTPKEVAEVEAAYSPAAAELRPHPWQGLVDQS
jgi:hypothetical protein